MLYSSYNICFGKFGCMKIRIYNIYPFIRREEELGGLDRSRFQTSCLSLRWMCCCTSYSSLRCWLMGRLNHSVSHLPPAGRTRRWNLTDCSWCGVVRGFLMLRERGALAGGFLCEQRRDEMMMIADVFTKPPGPPAHLKHTWTQPEKE